MPHRREYEDCGECFRVGLMNPKTTDGLPVALYVDLGEGAMARREQHRREEHVAACAAADVWAAFGERDDMMQCNNSRVRLARVLDALELATRESPLRKIKP